jgi:hypothetical protein
LFATAFVSLILPFELDALEAGGTKEITGVVSERVF